jgi:hypothetical protein
LALLELVKF